MAPSGKSPLETSAEEPKKPVGLSLYVCGGGKAEISFKGAPNNPGIIYTVKAKTNKAKDNLPTEICVNGLSCGVVILPNKYKAQVPKMAIQMAKKISLSSKCNCKTKSALDKNLNANANSKNPRETLTVFSQPPDFGSEFNQAGNNAKSINGKAIADEKPSIPTIGAIPPFEAASTKSDPTIGPVQEKDTNTSVKAIKNTPMNPPLSDFASTVFTKFDGNTISNAPKNEIPNKINIVKKSIFGIQCVLKKFAKLAPAKKANRVPKNT